MIRCEDCLHLLNARGDGELRPEDAAALDAHLSECASCRADAEGLRSIDADLRRAFAPRRAGAERVATAAATRLREATVPASPLPSSIAAPIAPSPRWDFGYALAGLVAGFLLAVALFRPWQHAETPISTPLALDPIARMAFASGPVEMRVLPELPSLVCPTDTTIAREAIVSTGPAACCEISMNDGCALRLDSNTEVTLRNPEKVAVNHGRLWSCSQPAGKQLEILSAGSTIVPRPATQFNLECRHEETCLTVVDGAVNVQAGGKSIEVESGRQVRIVEGKLPDASYTCDTLLETAWVNSVLALRNSGDPELVERVNRLLANVGAAKLSHLYEDELRRLGDDGVPPLVAYLAATRDTPDVAQRATAARIVGDVAQTRWIADLIGLLADTNPEVRLQAARGLERLTGRNQGCDAETWRSGISDACGRGREQWAKWWAKNRDRYPPPPRDSVTPTPASS